MYEIFFMVCALLCNFFCYCQDDLLSVIVVFRHGARTPIDPYPNDPYRNSSYWPVGFGQLTDAGKKEQYELGQWFRKRYGSFISANYSENDIYVKSTDVDRTLMSAEANLAGFFPPQNEFVENLAWQPIPVHSTKETEDELLAMKKSCPKYDKLSKELGKEPFFKNLSHTYHDLYAYLTRFSGTTVSDPDTVEYIYNTLTIERSFNFTLPPWTVNVFPKKMEYLSSLSFAMDTYTTDLARLKTGPFFNLITEHFKNVSGDFLGHHNHSKEDVWNRKFLIFSGHDTTIANILNSMGLFDLHSPPFASTILFELRRKFDNSTYLNLFYKNSSNPIQLCLKGCQLDCDLGRFIEILEPITVDPKRWKEECTLSWLDFLPFGYEGNIVAVTMLLSFTLISLCLLCALNCLKGEKSGKALYEQLSSEEA
ncbi:hypothetical protein HHI36_021163 [Cryptolaemus montrouzieri]|uniref:acid phosphatase n=1 Tax=Cryptolaemus montrouzieri TaxID=559131 RepID=A0ABD2MVX0_9CUCU